MFYLPVELADPKMGQPFLCVEIILVHETFKSQRSRFKHKLASKNFRKVSHENKHELSDLFK